MFLAAKGTVTKLGTDKMKKLTAEAEELLEKWPSCDSAQVTEGLQCVKELWEQFEKETLEHEKVVVYKYNYRCIHMYVHVYVRMYIHELVCIHIRTYIYINTHDITYTYVLEVYDNARKYISM